MFIKLTRFSDGPIYINMDRVVSITPHSECNVYTELDVGCEDESTYAVKETPEEILGLIENEKIKDTVRLSSEMGYQIDRFKGVD